MLPMSVIELNTGEPEQDVSTRFRQRDRYGFFQAHQLVLNRNPQNLDPAKSCLATFCVAVPMFTAPCSTWTVLGLYKIQLLRRGLVQTEPDFLFLPLQQVSTFAQQRRGCIGICKLVWVLSIQRFLRAQCILEGQLYVCNWQLPLVRKQAAEVPQRPDIGAVENQTFSNEKHLGGLHYRGFRKAVWSFTFLGLCRFVCCRQRFHVE